MESNDFCATLYVGTGTVSIQNTADCYNATLDQLGVTDLTGVKVETISQGQVQITDLESGTAVEFAVSALSAAGEGDNTASMYQQTTSDVDTHTVYSTTPDAPSNLKSTHQGTTTITLSWSAPQVFQWGWIVRLHCLP